MNPGRDSLPDNIEVLKTALIAERAEAARVAAELAVARAKASDDHALMLTTGFRSKS
jgi:transposase